MALMDESTDNKTAPALISADEAQLSKEALENRRFERLNAALDIKYRVIGADEEAKLLKQEEYVAPKAVKARTSEIRDFTKMAEDRQVKSEDISLGGMKISANVLIPMGSRLWIQVSLPEIPIPMNAIAEVRWRKPVGSTWSTGLSFSGISKPDLEKVDRYLTLQKRAQMEMRNSH